MALDAGSPQLQPRLGLGSGKRQETVGTPLGPRAPQREHLKHTCPGDPGSHSSRWRGPAAAKAPSPIQSTDGWPQATDATPSSGWLCLHFARRHTHCVVLEQLVCLTLLTAYLFKH